MNQITHRHHTLDPAEGPDLDEVREEAIDPSDDEEPIAGSDAVADGEDTEFD
ncbi:MAG: hypothetical protein FWD85_12085 [Microbacteriaceae bacterium]|nr:hypothetical protein [Microbacteriaceae bacterium]